MITTDPEARIPVRVGGQPVFAQPRRAVQQASPTAPVPRSSAEDVWHLSRDMVVPLCRRLVTRWSLFTSGAVCVAKRRIDAFTRRLLPAGRRPAPPPSDRESGSVSRSVGQGNALVPVEGSRRSDWMLTPQLVSAEASGSYAKEAGAFCCSSSTRRVYQDPSSALGASTAMPSRVTGVR